MRTLALLLLCCLFPLFAWAGTRSLCIERDSAAETNECAHELRLLVDDRLQARNNQLQARESTEQRKARQKRFKSWLESREQRCLKRTESRRDSPLWEAHFQDCLREASERHLDTINREAAASCTLRNATRGRDSAQCGQPLPNSATIFDF
ncbi:lysozyme inhibitor LprI family protein [Pseudomonas solani]|uniref:hypothetical protein n=1 Tax=Pseudomonas solani TaxID=2731552 RepID=UPI003D6BC8A0